VGSSILSGASADDDERVSWEPRREHTRTGDADYAPTEDFAKSTLVASGRSHPRIAAQVAIP
jgi:hypothetical protein